MVGLTEIRGSRIDFVSFGTTASAAKSKVVESFPGIKEHVTAKVGILNSFGRPTQQCFLGLSEFTSSSFLLSFILRGVVVMTAILMHLTDWLPSLALFASIEKIGATLACLLEEDNTIDVDVPLTSSSEMEGH